MGSACGEVAVGGFDKQMVVVTHLTVLIGVADPVETFADLCQNLHPLRMVGIVEIDGIPTVTTRRHVINSTGELYA